MLKKLIVKLHKNQLMVKLMTNAILLARMSHGALLIQEKERIFQMNANFTNTIVPKYQIQHIVFM